jgi:cell division protein FtsL
MKKTIYKKSFKNFVFIAMVGFYLIIYVFLYLKIIYFGYVIRKVKEEYETLNLLNKAYTLQFLKLITPENLEKIAKEKNLKLEMAPNWCFLEVKEENGEKSNEPKILEARTK